MAETIDEAREAAATTQAPTRNPGLKALEKLVGTWKVSGETKGQLVYEWLEGGFFFIARGDTEQGGKRTKHIEIRGYDHEAGAEPGGVPTPRLSTDQGYTLS